MIKQSSSGRRKFSIAVLLFLFSSVLVTAPTSQLAAAPGDAPVTGSLYVDFDRDGLIDPGEGLSNTDPLSPPAGVTVTAYDSVGGSAPCVVSAGAPATYSCAVTGLSGSDFRVEFELDAADVAAGWAGAPHGGDYGTNVQFVAAGSAADWATVPPSQCPSTGDGFGGNANSTDGKVFTTCFVNGDRDAAGPQDVLVGLNYDRTGAIESIGLKGDQDDATSASSELGSVWGIAYDEWTSTLFTSAFVKRQSQLGSAGLGGLYWVDYPTGTWNSVDLSTLGGTSFGTPFARDLEGTNFDGLSHDTLAHDLVGQIGIGDIDITADGRTLVVSNLAANTLELFDVSGVPGGGSPVFQSSIPIGNPGCPDTDNPGDYQVFAVKTVDSANAYVGVTCTAQTSQDVDDLAAFVLPVSLAGTVGAPVLNFPLNYPHQCGAATGCSTPDTFEPWTQAGFSSNPSRYEQPLLSDLELRPDGSLVIGIVDRWGHIRGNQNYSPNTANTNLYTIQSAGDILHACNTSGDPDNPTFVLEGAAGSACDASANFVDPSGGTVYNDGRAHFGPGGGVEWYGDDRFLAPSNPVNGHSETSHGGVYVHEGLDEVVLSAMDPTNFNQGGLLWLDNETGARVDGISLYRGRLAEGYLGKAAGIGDVEGCFIPIEIGNFVWLDLDGDGIQDPGETPLEGVTVTLTDADGNVVATTTTDANGEYYFDSADGVQANSDYVIGFDVSTNTSPLPGSFTNADLSETIPDSTASTGNDANDSDIVDGDIAATTGDPGANDHSFDAGFVLPFDLALDKQLADGTNLAVVAAGDSVTFTITVYNQGGQMATDVVVTDYLPASGLTLDDADWTDNGDGTAEITIDGPLAPDASSTVDITFTVDADAAGQVNNLAEISSADNDGDPATAAPVDVDSTPNAIPGDDTQPSGPNDATDDEIGESGLAGGDEDDHDIAGITVTPILDLALQKQLVDGSNLAVVAAGDSVTFAITVTNQGTANGSDIVVTDYLPASGLTLDDADWTDNGDGTAEITIAGPLAAGATSTVEITFTVDADASGQINNWAEISAVTPVDANGETIVDGDGNAIVDVDSTPNAIPGDDTQPSGPDDATDDEIGESGLAGGDEDDHDVAGVSINRPEDPIFDLALQKQLADGSNLATVSPGDTVTFALTVTNQGETYANDISVTDYLPEALTLADSDWTDNGDNTAEITIPGSVAPGASITVEISFTVDADASGQINNIAEISEAIATDVNGVALTNAAGEPLPDIDSIADDDPAGDNQPVGPNAATDDEAGEDGRNGGDEDDHDVAGVSILQPAGTPVFDLALRKQLVDGSNVVSADPGDEVSFLLTVLNQGDVAAANITLVDYVPTGLTLADSDWTSVSAGIATIQIAGPLPAGGVTTVQVTMTVDANASGTIDNFAEISAATAVDVNGAAIVDANGNALIDIDSTSDRTNNDTFELDDSITGSGLAGGDEDDHDIAQVTLIPPALAFTGAYTNVMVALAVLLMMFGAASLSISNRSTRRRYSLG